jgi:hypothetical protein
VLASLGRRLTLHHRQGSPGSTPDAQGLVHLATERPRPIVKRLDQSIRATVSGLDYAIKWKRAYYGLSELGWIIEIAAYDVSVNVVFLGGGDFESPPPLGTTDRTRYIKVTNLEEAQRPELQKWIEQAGRTAGWK